MDTDNSNLNTLKRVKLYNSDTVGKEFIEYFYTTWSSIAQSINNLNALTSTGIIKPYTKLKYNSNIFIGEKQIIDFFKSIGTIQFTNCNYEILDSDSRQVYILVRGNITNNQFNKAFCQSFQLMYASEKEIYKWNLINSLLLI